MKKATKHRILEMIFWGYTSEEIAEDVELTKEEVFNSGNKLLSEYRQSRKLEPQDTS